MYESHFDIYIEKENEIFQVKGSADWEVENDSFDYDYGSISSTHKLPDYANLQDFTIDKIILYDKNWENPVDATEYFKKHKLLDKEVGDRLQVDEDENNEVVDSYAEYWKEMEIESYIDSREEQ